MIFLMIFLEISKEMIDIIYRSKQKKEAMIEEVEARNLTSNERKKEKLEVKDLASSSSTIRCLPKYYIRIKHIERT